MVIHNNKTVIGFKITATQLGEIKKQKTNKLKKQAIVPRSFS